MILINDAQIRTFTGDIYPTQIFWLNYGLWTFIIRPSHWKVFKCLGLSLYLSRHLSFRPYWVIGFYATLVLIVWIALTNLIQGLFVLELELFSVGSQSAWVGNHHHHLSALSSFIKWTFDKLLQRFGVVLAFCFYFVYIWNQETTFISAY